MKTLSELRDLTVEALTQEVLSLRRMQFDQRMLRANGALDKTDKVRKTKKAIARVKTIITEKGGESHE